LISPIIALATWVDEDQSDDQFLFIRNHSSKNPDYAVLTFLVLFPHPDPSDLPDRSLDVISAVTPCHVPQTVTSDVPSTLTCYTTVDWALVFKTWMIHTFAFVFVYYNHHTGSSLFQDWFIKGTHPSVWHPVIPPSSCCPVSKHSVLFFKQSTVFNAFVKVSVKCGLRLKRQI